MSWENAGLLVATVNTPEEIDSPAAAELKSSEMEARASSSGCRQSKFVFAQYLFWA
jgi:hypothetical protein